MHGGETTRPMPAGFAECAWGNSRVLARRYGVGEPTIRLWRSQLGDDPRQLRLPDDFADRAASMGKTALCRHYGVSDWTIDRWARAAGVKFITGARVRMVQLRPPPDDFAMLAPTMSKNALRRHYGCWIKCLERWIRETGITPGVHTPKPKLPRYYRVPGQSNVTTLRNYGPHDEAVDILRRHFPVYRCDERGRQCEKGKLWRIGNAVADGDELLVRAARYRRAAA